MSYIDHYDGISTHVRLEFLICKKMVFSSIVTQVSSSCLVFPILAMGGRNNEIIIAL